MTLTEIAANPADALSARYDRAAAALDRMMEPENAEKWAFVAGVLYVESADGTDAWATDGALCDCPDATVGVGARLLGGTCKHIALFWLLARQRAERSAPRGDELTDRDTALLVTPVSIDPLFKNPSPRRPRSTLTFDEMFPA